MRRNRVSLNALVLLLSLGSATLLAAQSASARPRPKPPEAKAGRATSVRLRVVPVRYTGACPGKFKFLGTITTNGPAEVKYTWASFDGGTWPEHTLKFTATGTKEVTESREMGEAGKQEAGWMQLKVIAPNPLYSGEAKFVVACGAKHPPAKKK